MTTDDYKILAPTLPSDPGIYRYLDEDGTILYVGKAKNLKKRIASYFGEKKHLAYKTRVMIKNAHSLEYTLVESEHDALLLENTFIKKFQPRYNVMLKDGKSYVYICIKNERFPRVFFTRKVIRDGSTYFGPYTSKHRVNQIIELIRKLFPLRTCTLQLSESNIEKDKFKVCLEYHIKNCLGPCEGLQTQEDYDQNIDQIKNILRGNFASVKEYIRQQMEIQAQALRFEKAQQMKEKLDLFVDYQARSTVVSHTIYDVDVFTITMDEDEFAYVNYMKVVNGALINTDTVELKINLNDNREDLLRYIIPKIRQKYNSIAPELVLPIKVKGLEEDLTITIPQRGDKKKLLDLSEKNVKYFLLQKKKEAMAKLSKETSSERILKTLQKDLNMSEVPFHIECFDNSNIQGSHPVASCVVFKNAKPSKKDYRKFNIKTVVGPDDFASMEEVVYRRYDRMLKENQDLPQLIIIDGGKGQLSSAVSSLNKLNLLPKITVIGIAKKLEEIFFPGDSIPLYINKKSESLKIIQQARNEAHRFAITFHRNQRSKNFMDSAMVNIPGIGKKSIEKLIQHFGSLKKIQKAEPEEIQKIIGPAMSKKLVKYFTENNIKP